MEGPNDGMTSVFAGANIQFEVGYPALCILQRYLDAAIYHDSIDPCRYCCIILDTSFTHHSHGKLYSPNPANMIPRCPSTLP